MPIRLFKTPLIAAFFCAIVITGCSESPATPLADQTRCTIQTTPIASVQGAYPASKLIGEELTIQGIVTLIQEGEGLYVEEPDSDSNNGTSNAIFIQIADLPAEITPGSWISVQGTVVEIPKGRNSLTALTNISEVKQCSSGQVLPLTDLTLPLNGFGREAFEGMRIHVDGPLTVTDTYQLGRGRFSFSANGFQFAATEVASPGSEANQHTQQNRNNSLAAILPKNSPEPALLTTGTSISTVTGILTHDSRNLRLTLQSMSVEDALATDTPAQAGPGELRVVSMNLHNFFNGDGKGGEFPTPRGAKTNAEFDDQRLRLGAAIRELDPHVLAVMELENDGFGPLSAAADFIALANEATGASWQAAQPANGDTGSDKITVGLFYRDDLVETEGSARTLTGPEFRKSRQPLAQVFKQRSDGEKILVAVNHLKSKGSCPDSGVDANQKDGQSCWNPMRVSSTEKMAAWINSLTASTQTGNALILGDMNAYRQEDPIDAIRDAGFIELMDDAVGEAYSYIYFGQAGTLDYAFASASLQQKVQQAFIWHVNAAMPANMELPRPWLRFSDHDPVVVDVRLHQASTSD